MRRMRLNLALAASLIVLAAPLSALAGSLAIQPHQTAAWSTDPVHDGHAYDFEVISGVSGLLHSITTRSLVNVLYPSSRILSGYIIDCGTSIPTAPVHGSECAGGGTMGTYTEFLSDVGTGTPLGVQDTGPVTATLSSDMTLDPSHFYTVEFGSEMGYQDPVGATTTPATFENLYGYELGTVGFNAGSGFYPFLSLNDVDGYSPTSFSSILSIVGPTEGSTVTDVNVAFSFWYNSVCTASSTPYSIAGLNIQDNTISQTQQGPLETTACGVHLFQHSQVLQDGHSYTWTPFLYSTVASTTIDGPPTDFLLNTAGTTTEVTGLPSGLQNLWNAVQNNPPFGFIFQVRSQLSNLSASSSPAATLQVVSSIRARILDPLDIGLASVLWLFFARWLFFRAKHFNF